MLKRRHGKDLFSYFLIISGIAFILFWLPAWIWFVLIGIILIMIGIDIYKK